MRNTTYSKGDRLPDKGRNNLAISILRSYFHERSPSVVIRTTSLIVGCTREQSRRGINGRIKGASRYHRVAIKDPLISSPSLSSRGCPPLVRACKRVTIEACLPRERKRRGGRSLNWSLFRRAPERILQFVIFNARNRVCLTFSRWDDS